MCRKWLAMDSRDIGNEVSSNLARLPEIGPSHTHRKSSENQKVLRKSRRTVFWDFTTTTTTKKKTGKV